MDAPVLVLDEATAALDAESEGAVNAALAAATRGRAAVLSIAHRVSTMRAADVVAVVANGRVVETGPFAELAADPRSALASLVQRQLVK